MTEPQTISTALTAQLVINRIYRDQLTIQATIPKNQPPRKPGESILMGIDDMEKQQIFFNRIFIIAPFVIKGFLSLHEHIIEKGTTSPEVLDTLKRIHNVAKENISLFEEMEAIEPDETEFASYEIHPDSSISRIYKRSGNYEGQRFTNDDLFEYCGKVEDLISSCLPNDASVDKEKTLAVFRNMVEEINQLLPQTKQPAAKDRKPKPITTFISHLVMGEDKKQPFADQLKSNFKDLTGKDLAVMFYAAKEYIKLRNLKSLLEDWQRFIDRDIKRDEAMNKVMRKLNEYPEYYDKELKVKQEEIQTICKSIE